MAKPLADVKNAERCLCIVLGHRNIALIARKKQSERKTAKAAAGGSSARSKSTGVNTPTTVMPPGASAGRHASIVARRLRPGTAQIKITVQLASGFICGMQDISLSASEPRIHTSPSATANGKKVSVKKHTGI